MNNFVKGSSLFYVSSFIIFKSSRLSHFNYKVIPRQKRCCQQEESNLQWNLQLQFWTGAHYSTAQKVNCSPAHSYKSRNPPASPRNSVSVTELWHGWGVTPGSASQQRCLSPGLNIQWVIIELWLRSTKAGVDRNMCVGVTVMKWSFLPPSKDP